MRGSRRIMKTTELTLESGRKVSIHLGNIVAIHETQTGCMIERKVGLNIYCTNKYEDLVAEWTQKTPSF